jgi:hypothetical protein
MKAPKHATSTELANGRLPKHGPTHSEDGVDLTLIRWMLSLTPAERLQVLQRNVRSILRLRAQNPKM